MATMIADLRPFSAMKLSGVLSLENVRLSSWGIDFIENILRL
jgi:hypothetical protein